MRYADDCNIYVRSERAGRRVMEGIERFVTRRLRLRVNAAKSAVARPWERTFVGFYVHPPPGAEAADCAAGPGPVEADSARGDAADPRGERAGDG